VGVMPTGKTIIINTYIRTVTEMRKCFKWVWIHNNPTEILLQHDCARFHTSTKSWKAIKKKKLYCAAYSHHIYPAVTNLEPCRMRSVVWRDSVEKWGI